VFRVIEVVADIDEVKVFDDDDDEDVELLEDFEDDDDFEAFVEVESS